ncbi:transcription factor bHLH126-like [Chenopodium quinoa]|uniref:BHLH domain-containing protein n=1 Tax=Chenopodium quinoa TaxID=63459 RepID=A0A803LQV7_CHEQI|nr:transcription factor bHLH126-like [Chenopodium quinoa]
MTNLFSSIMFDPLCSQNNEIFLDISDFVPSTQFEGDQITPILLEPQHNYDLDNLFNEIPTFIEDPPLKPNLNRKKRSLAIVHDQENNGINPYDSKKKKKIIHREIERKRRLEMSSLHTSLKSLLPVEYTKGKRSISDHLGEAVKYIKQMQQKMQVLNEKRDTLTKEVSKLEGHKKYDNDVIVNVKKENVEVIVSSNCREDDENEGQGLPLSKVLQCLVQEGLDVLSSTSKKINTIFVHSIQAQAGEDGKIAIDATNLKNKIADIQR